MAIKYSELRRLRKKLLAAEAGFFASDMLGVDNLMRWGKGCFYCGALGTQDAPLTADHYLPSAWRKGMVGKKAPYNLVPACERCNTRKGDVLPWPVAMLLLHTHGHAQQLSRWKLSYAVRPGISPASRPQGNIRNHRRRRKVYERQGGVCFFCPAALESPEKCVLTHLIPADLYATTGEEPGFRRFDNKVATCVGCDPGRADRMAWCVALILLRTEGLQA